VHVFARPAALPLLLLLLLLMMMMTMMMQLERALRIELGTAMDITPQRIRVLSTVPQQRQQRRPSQQPPASSATVGALVSFELVDDPLSPVSAEDARRRLLALVRRQELAAAASAERGVLSLLDLEDPLGQLPPRVRLLPRTRRVGGKHATAGASRLREATRTARKLSSRLRARVRGAASQVARDVAGPQTSWSVAGHPELVGPLPAPARIASAAAYRKARDAVVAKENVALAKRLETIYEANPEQFEEEKKLGKQGEPVDCRPFWKKRTAYLRSGGRMAKAEGEGEEDEDEDGGVGRRNGIPSSLGYVICSACGTESFYGADGPKMIELEAAGVMPATVFYCSEGCKEIDAENVRYYKGDAMHYKRPASGWTAQSAAEAKKRALLHKRKRGGPDAAATEEVEAAMEAAAKEEADAEAQQAKDYEAYMNGTYEGEGQPQPTAAQSERAAATAQPPEEKREQPQKVMGRLYQFEPDTKLLRALGLDAETVRQSDDPYAFVTDKVKARTAAKAAEAAAAAATTAAEAQEGAEAAATAAAAAAMAEPAAAAATVGGEASAVAAE
jgi:hypothetical protein